MRQIHRTILVALAATLLAGVPANAAEVILVKGDRAVRVNDPSVPSEAEIALALPGGPVATTARARARASARPRADRRAVLRALRSRKLDPADARRWRRSYAGSLRTYRRLGGARRQQLGYVIDSVEALALAGRLIRTRMPACLLYTSPSPRD